MDWLDDLSEEWVSEAQDSSSSHEPSTLSNGSVAYQHNNIDGSRRRVPSNGSLLYGGLPGKRVTSTASKRGALTERNTNSVRFAISTDKPNAANLSRSVSHASSRSDDLQGSVNRKSVSVSPPKSRNHDTPEWKRRLLQNNVGVGEKTDLFSPIGLQKMFAQPAPAAEKPKKIGLRGLSFLQGLENIPSSPPQFSSEIHASLTSPRKKSAGAVRNLAILEEEEEHSVPKFRSESSSRETVVNKPDLRASGPYSEPMSNHGSQLSLDDSETSVHGAMPRGLRHLRTVSGQSEQVSDFSPVFIAKHNTTDGKVDYAAIDMSRSQLEEHLRSWGGSQASRQASSASYSSQKSLSTDESLLSRLQSDGAGLPENLPAGTPEPESIGDFVTMHRGGQSEDGSFSRRPLSPSPLRKPINVSTPDYSMFQSELSALACGDSIRPRAPTPPALTQDHKRNNIMTSVETVGNLEGDGSSDVSHSASHGSRATSTESTVRHIIGDNSGPDGATGDFTPTDQVSMPGSVVYRQPHFGQGELDQHDFHHGVSNDTSSQDIDVQSLRSSSPAADVAPPGSQQPKRFQVADEEVIDTFRGKRKISKLSAQSTLSIRKRNGDFNTADSKSQRNVSHHLQVHEGKRPPNSPRKEPTPKRRRTLVAAEMPSPDNSTVSSAEEHNANRGRKRKDARYGSGVLTADPDILASRKLLRPRNPTPSQRRRQEVENEILEATRDFIANSPQLNAIQEHLTIPEELIDEPSELDKARVVAGEVAAFSEKVVQGVRDHGRKRSVTTQDFLDEAMKIMNFIRTKGRPGSALASVAEGASRGEPSLFDDIQEEDEMAEGLHLTVSRPPSREGGPSAWRSRETKPINAQVLDHLAKYQERGEYDFFAGSMRPLRVQEEQPEYDSADFGTMYDDNTPAIIIHQASRTPSAGASHVGDRSRTRESDDGRPATHRSNGSIDSSVGRSTVSHKTQNVGTIAPTAVAELLQGQVGVMVFDKDTNSWARSPKKEKKFIEEIMSVSVSQSEDDPFDDIPDLSVDESLEKRRITLSQSLSRELDQDAEQSDEGSVIINEQFGLPTSEDSPFNRLAPSSPSSNGSVIHNEIAEGDTSMQADNDQQWEDVEDEIHIDESRVYESQNRITSISVCLPLPDEIQITQMSKAADYGHVDPSIFSPTFRTSPTRGGTVRNGTIKRTGHTLHRTVLEQSMRRRQAATCPSSSPPQPVGDSISIFKAGSRSPSRAQRSRQITLRSPSRVPSLQIQTAKVVPSSPNNVELTFLMSDLPDFTVNQIDEREIPVRTVTRRDTARNLVALQEDRFESGNKALVRALQDSEPEEPYWEDLKTLTLQGKSLTSLNILGDMCDRLDTLDLSNNQVTQLSGAPSSLRSLCIKNNALTGLTAWHQLVNLQYLDVSGNQIENLLGFEHLVHLRELRADGNRIQRLDGILHLDGLLHLSIAGNQLEEVDFGPCTLRRLESLDVSRNRLTAIHGLQTLSALTSLCLDNNSLTFVPAVQDGHCARLARLSMKHNRMSNCDGVAKLAPSLSHLDLDHNDLSSTAGLAELRSLQVLSLRSQSSGSTEDQEQAQFSITSLPDITSLYISDNHLPQFDLTHDLPSLKHFEAANCGIQSLPTDLSSHLLNIRTLNLNFNRITDLTSLRGCKRLVHLSAAGNKIGRMRKTAAVINRLRALEMLDLRDNPVTCGLYASSQSRKATKEVCTTVTTSSRGIYSPHVPEDVSSLYTLPDQDPTQASTHYTRLDDDSKLGRQVFELLLTNTTHETKLSHFNGLSFPSNDQSDQHKAETRAQVWRKLSELGIVGVESVEELVAQSAGKPLHPGMESRGRLPAVVKAV